MTVYDMVYTISVPIYVMATYYLFRTFFKSPKNRKIEVASYTLLCIFQIGLYFITIVPIFTFLFGVISCALLSFNYKCGLAKGTIKVTYIIIIKTSLETVIAFAFLNIGTNLLDDSEAESAFVIVMARTILLILGYSLYRFTKNRNKEYKIPTYHYALQTVVLLGILFLYLTSINKSDISATAITVNSCALVLVILVIISSDEKIYESTNLYVENTALEEQNLSYENQNRIINQSNKNIATIKHDIKNHLITLKSLNKSHDFNEMDIYIEKLLNEIDMNKKFVNSNNYIIDSLLNFKLQSLDDLNVDLIVEANVAPELNISNYDLTVILGNLIDNAIEAIKEVRSDRMLKIHIKLEKGSLIILMKNSHNSDMGVLKKKLSKAGKKQGALERGLGIENAKGRVESYNGSFTIEYSEKLFSVVVFLPYMEK